MKLSVARHLLILRHGQARKDLPSKDRERPLTEEGRDDIRRVAVAAVKVGLLPDLVLCSSAVRARETAELFLAAAHAQTDVAFMDTIYDGAADDLLKLIAEAPAAVRRLMLVGHNPALEGLVRRLCGDHSPSVGLNAGALAVFEIAGAWTDISPQTAVLKELIDPRA